MHKKIAVDAAYPGAMRVALLNQKGEIEEIEYETAIKNQIKANLYLAKVVRVEPSLQAVFIDYGAEKNGFLPFSEIHPDYWNLPSEARAQIKLAEHRSLNRPEITSEDLSEKEATSLYSGEEEAGNIAIDALDAEIDQEATEILDIYKQYKVQEVIKKGQVLLVQAQKEERGNKGASFTTYISLAGKYCVLMPNRPGHNGISRRISNSEERRRLRNIIEQLIEGAQSAASVIVRTAGISRTTYDIKRDYDYLVRLWNNVREATLRSKAPAFIHAEDDILKKTIRDLFDHNKVKEIVIQGSTAYTKACEFMHNLLPSEVNKIIEYKSKTPIFTKYDIEDQLVSLYQPIVYLPSGGYIVINPTEALTSVDVNSGKATAERNIEETATKTNIEAAVELARQLKLRDIAGLVVIDFIDMYEAQNRHLVERKFRDALERDKARIQIGQISNFGLLEMSRQRLKPSFLECNTSVCHHCHGKGIVRADESNAMLIFRTIANEIATHKAGKISTLNVFASFKAANYILNYRRSEVAELEQKFALKVNIYGDHTATADSFAIEKIGLNKAKNECKESNVTQVAVLSEADIAVSELTLAEDKRVEQASESALSQEEKATNSADSVNEKKRAARKRRIKRRSNSPREKESSNNAQGE